MPRLLVGERLRRAKDALGGPGRYQDLALLLVRAKTGETLLRAGGRWDRLDRCFTSEEPETCARIKLEESQVEFTLWFATFLRDYREGFQRDVSLALVSGDRRGGKTFDTYFCQVAALIDVPTMHTGLPTIGWTISRTFRHREELDQLISAYIPTEFYTAQRAPEHRYTFAHGSVLRNLSADDPDAMKQGRCDFLLYNEAQLMSPRAIKNGLYGTADAGGLCVLAANPPSGPEGEWLRQLKEGIEEDPEFGLVARFFNFSSKDNSQIDQPARRRIVKIATRIDPEGAEADAEGIWKPWGDRAYPSWDGRTLEREGLVGSPPERGMVDLTPVVTRREVGWSASVVIGGDFQRQPEAAALLRVLDAPDGPIYWFVQESQVKGDELALSASVMALGQGLAVDFPRDGVWIADCSGSFQGSERVPGRTSFSLLEQHGWIVEAAEVIRIPERSAHPRNPLVGARLNLMSELMKKRRIRVDPRCEILIQAFKECQLRLTEYGKRVPKGRWAHITDAACYPIWRLESKPDGRGRLPSKRAMTTVDFRSAPGGWY